MKKIIFTLAVITFITGTILTSFGQNADKKTANTKKQPLTEFQIFRKEANKKVIANEKSIADFKVKIGKVKNEDAQRNNYAELAVLGTKNSDLKNKLDNYEDSGTDKLKAFKIDVNRELDELGKSLKEFKVRTNK